MSIIISGLTKLLRRTPIRSLDGFSGQKSNNHGIGYPFLKTTDRFCTIGTAATVANMLHGLGTITSKTDNTVLL